MVISHLYRAHGPHRWRLVAEVEAATGDRWPDRYAHTTTAKEDRRIRRPAMMFAPPGPSPVRGLSSPHSQSRIYLDRQCRLITAIQTFTPGKRFDLGHKGREFMMLCPISIRVHDT